MTEDERIDEIIRSAASDYHRPPATPKDDMWSAIEAARVSAGAGPRLHVAAGGPSRSAGVSYETRGRSTPAYAWFGVAAAAALLVATGAGIGRNANRDGGSERQIAEAPQNASERMTAEGVPAPAPATDEAPSSAEPSRREAQGSGRSRSREEIRRNPIVTGIRPITRLANAPAVADAPPNAISYQVATTRHLADAEALLTSFSLDSRDERMNAQFARWARGLLSNTRLLLDSPAGEDPRRARLLQDLELVLAQIVQISPNAQAQDRELIQGTIQDGQVMTRLRTAIPAGQPNAITER